MDLARLQLPPFLRGSVWLVGAGPGDPGLLSALALHALEIADAIVYDALVDRRIVALGRDEALRVYAGKRGGRPSSAQPDISATLVRLAREGRAVLRLKGGDPFIFGRGGEEALALVEAGIPFRVVPGVTAGIGGLAYAGIPATHRDYGSSVTFVTGHDSAGGVPAVDWGAIARGSPTIVLYMSLRHLEHIAARLIEAGRPLDEPTAIISKATTSDQRVWTTTLSQAAEVAVAAEIEAPTIIVIGAIAVLRDRLAWFSERDLPANR
ncbi:MAG: uroporphyrinogen-III C-methyltransferase [Alphaproteobacteria bacterium]|nr:uroporphyrinogen-III C-methyltransferase [Alphaproteobacteria bacterium]